MGDQNPHSTTVAMATVQGSLLAVLMTPALSNTPLLSILNSKCLPSLNFPRLTSGRQGLRWRGAPQHSLRELPAFGKPQATPPSAEPQDASRGLPHTSAHIALTHQGTAEAPASMQDSAQTLLLGEHGWAA